MKIVENKEAAGETVVLDDCSFINCKFTGCTVIYDGGEFSWINTRFENCAILLRGPAERTQKFLTHFGWKPPDNSKQLVKPN
jgi:hypothetical protein